MSLEPISLQSPLRHSNTFPSISIGTRTWLLSANYSLRVSAKGHNATLMRILYCNKYNFAFSGTEVYLFDLMELMRTKGHTVALFSMADSRGAPTKYDQHFLPLVDFKNNSHGMIGGPKLAAHAIYSRD